MLIENFRDDSLAQYGLDYASLSAANPGLISFLDNLTATSRQREAA